jgi:PIN domain nuclease of toxin-antitoxin system
MAIKISLGKWTLHRPYEDFIDLALNKYGFQVLAILPSHTSRLIALPFLLNHRDPFDRLLVAQALSEGIPIASADQQLDLYHVGRLW